MTRLTPAAVLALVCDPDNGGRPRRELPRRMIVAELRCRERGHLLAWTVDTGDRGLWLLGTDADHRGTWAVRELTRGDVRAGDDGPAMFVSCPCVLHHPRRVRHSLMTHSRGIIFADSLPGWSLDYDDVDLGSLTPDDIGNWDPGDERDGPLIF